MDPQRQNPPSRRHASFIRGFWVILGIGALGLGLIGIILPVLPTTPFVLLAAFAFSRGSERLNRWLEDHPRFGPVIADWRENGAISRRHKRLAVIMMVATFVVSLALGLAPAVLIVQAICMTGAAIYVFTRPDGKM